MAFPQSPLGVRVQANLQGLGWTDVTRDDSKPYRLLAEQGVAITRGRDNEQGRTSASTCTFTEYDPTGVFNNDNPRSPYFGILPRNTPVRVVVPRPTTAFFLAQPTGTQGAYGQTNDKAQLKLTGTTNLDIRIDFEPSYWPRNRKRGQALVGKWRTGTNQRSWFLYIDGNGFANLTWTTDGTLATRRDAVSTVALPNVGRVAVRALLEVSVGGTTSRVTFSTAPTINGTYTQLGAVVNFASTTTIFDGTAQLTLGAADTGINGFAILDVFTGRIYGMQMRNASTAAIVAQPDFTAQANGTISFADGVGNTWNIGTAGIGTFEITNADYRFHGELTNVSQVPEVTSRATLSQFTCSGLIRRLQQNATPLRSPIYRNFAVQQPTGYWPLEDGSTTTQAGSAVPGSNPAPLTDITFTTDTMLPGSAGVAVLGGTGPLFTGIAKATANGTQASLVAYFKFPSIPLSEQTLFTLFSTGTGVRAELTLNATAYQLKVYGSDGAVLTSSGMNYTNVSPLGWVGVNIRVKNVTTTAVWTADFFNATNNTFYTMTGLSAYTGISGRFTKLLIQGVAALSGVRLAHLLLTQYDFTFTDPSFSAYSLGYAGETAGARWKRLLVENNLPGFVVGDSTDSELMGPQSIDEVVNLLYEIQDVDGGEIFEGRDYLGLCYRTRASMTDQFGQSLSYVTGKQLAAPIKPVPDDSGVTNDVTISRKNGGSARASLEAGPMSAADPTAGGIGRAPTSPTINNFADSRLTALAQYALGIGTWPEARYPSVSVALHRSVFTFYDATFSAVTHVDVSDFLGVTDLPSFLPPDALTFVVRGYTENLYGMLWTMEFNTTPYGPYRQAVLSSIVGQEKRADSSNTTLAASLTTTATSASFATPTGALCVTTAAKPAEFPFDVIIGGERVTVTAITGTTSPQTATITRSVNGIVKAQASGAAVKLPVDTAMYLGL